MIINRIRHTKATEVFSDDMKVVILYSYDTPVIVWPNKLEFPRVTKKFHSKTTTRHINEWLKTNETEGIMVSQGLLSSMVPAALKNRW